MKFVNGKTLNELELYAMGEMLSEYGGNQLALDISKRGGSVRDLIQRVAARARDETLDGVSDRMLGISGLADSHGYSITSALNAETERSWSKAGLEKNMSDLVATKSGTIPNGFFIPLGIMARDFNIGTSNQAGNLVGADVNGSIAVDPLRKLCVLGGMGANFITGVKSTMSLPRFDSTSTPAWKTEVAAADHITETTQSITLTPKRLAVDMVLSRQALFQASPYLDAAISRHLISALMSQVEDAALNADGTSDSPVGLRSTSGVGNVVGGTDGATITFAHLADLENAPALLDVQETMFSGFVVNAKTRRWLRTATKGTNLPFIWDGGDYPLLGRRAAVSNLLPSNLAKGASGTVCSAITYSADWSNLVVAIYGGGVDVLVDRVTLADIGKIKITASLQVGLGINLPSAFSKMDDAKTA